MKEKTRISLSLINISFEQFSENILLNIDCAVKTCDSFKKAESLHQLEERQWRNVLLALKSIGFFESNFMQ